MSAPMRRLGANFLEELEKRHEKFNELALKAGIVSKPVSFTKFTDLIPETLPKPENMLAALLQERDLRRRKPFEGFI